MPRIQNTIIFVKLQIKCVYMTRYMLVWMYTHTLRIIFNHNDLLNSINSNPRSPCFVAKPFSYSMIFDVSMCINIKCFEYQTSKMTLTTKTIWTHQSLEFTEIMLTVDSLQLKVFKNSTPTHIVAYGIAEAYSNYRFDSTSFSISFEKLAEEWNSRNFQK